MSVDVKEIIRPEILFIRRECSYRQSNALLSGCTMVWSIVVAKVIEELGIQEILLGLLR